MQEDSEPGHLPGFRIDIDDPRNAPRSESNQTPWGGSSSGNSSDPLFSMYVKMAEEEDNKMAERWKADAEGILIFTGLFSATVATLATASVQDLKPDPQATSAFYLENIYQLSANPNISSASIPSAVARPPTFTPPRSAVWVNSLWFLSLVISLTCALLATLLRQWAHRYITITQPPRCSLRKQALIRAFFAEGVDKLHLPWAVETLPILLHLSVFLFFAGLLVYLFSINHTVFSFAASCVGISAGIYAWMTFIPLFRHDSPYYTPLSSSVWVLYAGLPYAALEICRLIRYRRPRIEPAFFHISDLTDRYGKRLSGGLWKAAEHTALASTDDLSCRILQWTFDAVDEDHELVQFLEALPGFCSSEVNKGPRSARWTAYIDVLFALARFFIRTQSSELAPDSVKQRHSVICTNAARAVFQDVRMGYFMMCTSYGSDRHYTILANTIAASIVANALKRDDEWIALAMIQLDVSEHVLQDYLAHGDSLLLATVINVIHRIRNVFLNLELEMTRETWFMLQELAKFDAQNTLPELQHEFCAMWNEIVLGAQTRSGPSRLSYVLILFGIRQIYIALHQGTDAPPTAFTAFTFARDDFFGQVPSFPLCTIQGHRHLDSVPHSTDGETTTSTDGETTPTGDETTPSTDGETTPSSTATPSTESRHDVIPTAVSPSTGPDSHSLTVPNSDHTSLDLGNVPDAQQSSIPMAPSSYIILETLDRDRCPAASLNIPTGGATKRISVISSATNPLSRSFPSGSSVQVPQQTEPTLIAPHSVMSTIPSTHLMQAIHSVVPVGTLPSSDPTTSTSGHIFPGLAPPPSASATAASSAPPQAASVSDSDVPTRIAHTRSLDHSQDISAPSLVEHSHRPNTSHLSAPGTATGTLKSDEDSDSSEDLAISTHDQTDIAD